MWLPSLPFMNVSFVVTYPRAMGTLIFTQEYTWPDGSLGIGGADLDQWRAIAHSMNFTFE